MADDLQDRIAARLHEALDRHAAAGIESGAERGMVDRVPDEGLEPGAGPTVRLSVEDVARIAAAEARGHL